MNQTVLIIQQNSAELQYLCTVISTDGSENGEDKWVVLDPINYSYGEFTYLDPFRLYSRLLSFFIRNSVLYTRLNRHFFIFCGLRFLCVNLITL
jgi:hypothetical protein